MNFRVTYLGDGVTSNPLGAFQRHTTANTTDETLARSLAADRSWEVRDAAGAKLGVAQVEPEPVTDEQPTDDQAVQGKRKKH